MDSNVLSTLMSALAVKDGVKVNDMVKIAKNILIADIGIKIAPIIFKKIGNIFQNKTKMIQGVTEKSKSASLQLFKSYETVTDNDMFDSVIWKVSETPQTKHLKRMNDGIYVINNKDTIELDVDILIKQISITFEDNTVKESCIEVFSYTMDLLKLKEFLSELQRKYVIHKNNQLGDEIYYFDEIPNDLPIDINGNTNYEVAPKFISFTMSKLLTNKSMNTVYGDAMKKVRHRVGFFMKNKKWYEDQGIPYTLGILLYGSPGCGKTSLIKALSKDCKRHVFNLKLTDNSTIHQIQNIFFNEKVNVVKDGVSLSYIIPIDKRLIVIEDIDCLSDMVLHRNDKLNECENKDSNNTQNYFDIAPYHQYNQYGNLSNNPDKHVKKGKISQSKLTLSVFLNVLDGVLETQGRILVMTTNHPEKLDAALIRPGRIDLKVNFEKCTVKEIHEMIEKITKEKCDLGELDDIPDYLWTPAEVTQKIFENINDIPQIINSLHIRDEGKCL